MLLMVSRVVQKSLRLEQTGAQAINGIIDVQAAQQGFVGPEQIYGLEKVLEQS